VESDRSGILLGVVRDWLLEPIVVAADGHLEDATHHLHAVLPSMRFDEMRRDEAIRR